MEMKMGFEITAIQCSGCDFNGRIAPDPGRIILELHPDLRRIEPLKESLWVLARHAHNNRRALTCQGGILRVSFGQVMIMPTDAKITIPV